MRFKRLRGNAWAARFGVLALVLNALVPVHLAFDLADALGAPEPLAAADWQLLARLSGHAAPAHDHDRGHGGHRAPDCPVCSALGALAGLTPAAEPLLSLPVAHVDAPVFAPAEEHLDGGAVAAYRSRAPPLL